MGSLLAFLALHRGKEVSNATLQELLWPDSDGDRQAQSLRRAVADLRNALEDQTCRSGLVRTHGGTTSLDPDSYDTDLDLFEGLLSRSGDSLGLGIAEALAMYGGPLLAPFDDDWVFAYRRQVEERYCVALERFCSRLCEQGHAREAVRIATAGIVAAPLREEPYWASIRGYAAMGNRSMALRQYETLEQMLDDHFGQTPSEVALAALENPLVPAVESPNPAEVSPTPASGHGQSAEVDYYVLRDADAEVDRALDAGEAVLLVFGPRQVGKTSLISRAAHRQRGNNVKVAVSDFQAFGKSEVDRASTLYRALVHSLATALGQPYEPSWNEWVGANSNLDSQVDSLLKKSEGQVLWAMDEVDRLFGTDYADDFFGLVRSWHNRRALDPDGPWRRLTLLISYATEAHLFIKDLNQSPFNVGVRVNLRDFNETEVASLAERYPEPLTRYAEEVFDVARGHPYLTRRAFGFLQAGGTVEQLRAIAASEDGPFGDHLKRLLSVVKSEPETLNEVCRLLRGEPLASPETRDRLTAAGLLARSGGSLAFRTPIYEAALRSCLLPSS